ncbi:MAG TPA: ATP-dependent DNA ligase [Actinopolymorphaceae bacterium]|jgi:DNA ligase D-like protein (predicted polymerase)
MAGGEERHGVPLTNLDQPLLGDAGPTKRDLVDYLDAMADRVIPELAGRPLSVIRVLRGQKPFMQKNLSSYAPDWIKTFKAWTETSKREIAYPLCEDRRTLVWLANQRAVEYHPTLMRMSQWGHATHLVLDIDPPAVDDREVKDAPDEQDSLKAFAAAVKAAFLVRDVLEQAGLAGVVKTSGAKGIHVFVPLDEDTTVDDAAAATRALAARAERLDPALVTTAFIREDRGGKVFLDSSRAGGATVVAVYSPRVRPGLPVSFPLDWNDVDRVHPADFTIRNVAGLLGDRNPWVELMPEPQRLSDDLVQEGHAIPVARVQAMHEGKRRARARREAKKS